MQTPINIYEAAGGENTFRRLIEHFYGYVAAHPDLSPLFPEDFSEIKAKQYAFLTQFFGGPPLYLQEYGQPMMRARHLRFPVTPKRAKAWLSCMSRAMDDVGLEGQIRQFMFQRLNLTANHMVNTEEE
nr:globin [Alicyclobacillus sp. SO9]